MQKLKWHKSTVFSVAFSPDGQTILTGSWDNTARLWELFKMPLEEYLEKGNVEHLSDEQKKEYGIK